MTSFTEMHSPNNTSKFSHYTTSKCRGETSLAWPDSKVDKPKSLFSQTNCSSICVNSLNNTSKAETSLQSCQWSSWVLEQHGLQVADNNMSSTPQEQLPVLKAEFLQLCTNPVCTVSLFVVLITLMPDCSLFVASCIRIEWQNSHWSNGGYLFVACNDDNICLYTCVSLF